MNKKQQDAEDRWARQRFLKLLQWEDRQLRIDSYVQLGLVSAGIAFIALKLLGWL